MFTKIVHRVIREGAATAEMAYSGDASTNRTRLDGYIHIADRSTNAYQRIAYFRQPRWGCAEYAEGGKAKAKIGSPLKKRQPITGFVIGAAWRGLAHRQFEMLADG